MAKEFTFEIKQNLGVIYSTRRGRKEGDAWLKEVNLVSWNEAPTKVDIRDWNEDHTRMSKGIALSESEAREVMEILTDYFNRKDGDK